MSFNVISRKVNARKVIIKLEDGSLVEGKINLHRNDLDVQRVSDLFTKVNDPFLVVFDITSENKSGKCLILNKRNIVWIEPQDERREESEEFKVSVIDRLRSV